MKRHDVMGLSPAGAVGSALFLVGAVIAILFAALLPVPASYVAAGAGLSASALGLWLAAQSGVSSADALRAVRTHPGQWLGLVAMAGLFALLTAAFA